MNIFFSNDRLNVHTTSKTHCHQKGLNMVNMFIAEYTAPETNQIRVRSKKVMNKSDDQIIRPSFEKIHLK